MLRAMAVEVTVKTEVYGDPDPSSGNFDVQVFWSLVTP
jgi:hypothetical protein